MSFYICVISEIDIVNKKRRTEICIAIKNLIQVLKMFNDFPWLAAVFVGCLVSVHLTLIHSLC